jgi:Arc/MetJ family transcription regulator
MPLVRERTTRSAGTAVFYASTWRSTAAERMFTAKMSYSAVSIIQTMTTTKRARKTLDIDPALLEDVRVRLGVRTEREAVTRSLEQMQRQLRMADLIHELHGMGRFDVTRIED